MKKILSILFTTTLLLDTVFAGASKMPELSPIEIEPVILKNEYTTFVFDSRTEIIGILCRLAEMSDFQGYYNGENSYTAQIDKYFKKHSQLSAVKTTKSFIRRGFKANDFFSLAFHIKKDFSGPTVDFNTIPATLSPRWHKVKQSEIYNYIKQIHDFVETSNYPRINLFMKADKLSDVAYFREDMEKLQLAQWAKEYFGKMDFGTPIVNVSRTCPGLYFSNLATNEQGKTESYATFFPQMYYSNMIDCYNNAFLIELETSIWEQVKEKFCKFYLYKVKSTSTEDQYKKFVRDFEPNAYFLEIFLSFPQSLNYYKSPYFDAYTEKEPDTGLTYDSYYSYYEKYFSNDCFYKLVNLFEEYNVSRDKYFNINDIASKTVTTISRIPDPKE